MEITDNIAQPAWDAYLLRAPAAFPAGSNAEDWLRERDRGNPATRVAALISAGVLVPTAPAAPTHFLVPLPKDAPLNLLHNQPIGTPPTSGQRLAEDLAVIAARLYDSVLVNPEARQVKYNEIAEQPAWRDFVTLFAHLPFSPPSLIDSIAALPDAHKKSLFFNLYNLVVWFAKLRFGHPKSAAAKGRFFGPQSVISIAGARVNLTELEHDVLRRHAVRDRSRDSAVPHAKWAPDVKDPRMHFALNCGAHSCPPYRAFTPDRCEEELEEATAQFLENDIVVEDNGARIRVSRLLKWFRDDFTPGQDKSTSALFEWIVAHASESTQKRIRTRSNFPRVKFKKYNWADNSEAAWHSPPEEGGMFIYDISFALNK